MSDTGKKTQTQKLRCPICNRPAIAEFRPFCWPRLSHAAILPPQGMFWQGPGPVGCPGVDPAADRVAPPRSARLKSTPVAADVLGEDGSNRSGDVEAVGSPRQRARR